MKFSKTQLSTLGIVILSFITAIFVYPKMPSVVASHWDIQGQVNGYMPRFWGIFLMPLISLFLFVLFLIIPKIDPLKENIDKFKKNFDRFVQAFFVFFFYIYFLTIVWNLGFKFNFVQFLSPAFAFLFYFTAILVEKAKPNWTIGIRTPWTLNNLKVWEKTHKVSGKLYKVSSAIALLGIILPRYAFYFILLPILFSTIFSFAYSYFEFQKKKIK